LGEGNANEGKTEKNRLHDGNESGCENAEIWVEWVENELAVYATRSLSLKKR
jgi:hypothetical protein